MSYYLGTVRASNHSMNEDGHMIVYISAIDQIPYQEYKTCEWPVLAVSCATNSNATYAAKTWHCRIYLVGILYISVIDKTL